MTVQAITDRVDSKTIEVRLERDGRPLSWRALISDLHAGTEAAWALSSALRDLPFDGFRWETPPLVATGLDEEFECVAVDDATLARIRADPAPFSEQLAEAETDVAVFPNLGGDAVLVAPRAPSRSHDYAHFGAFLRTAPADQVARIWGALADALLARLAGRAEPVWVSTAGLGVAWLHLRIDDRPKYYVHAAYRSTS